MPVSSSKAGRNELCQLDFQAESSLQPIACCPEENMPNTSDRVRAANSSVRTTYLSKTDRTNVTKNRLAEE